MDVRNISEKVFHVRKNEMKLTQEKFAELIDVSKDTVSNIERGKVIPCTETMVTMSKRTGKTIDYYVSKGDNKTNE